MQSALAKSTLDVTAQPVLERRSNFAASSSRPATVHSLDKARHRKLLTEYGSLVERIARQMHSKMGFHCSVDEMRSAGWIGLMEAARRYDANRGIPFEAFARPRIHGAILDEVRMWDSLPRPARKRAREVENVRRRLTKSLQREPGTEEIARVVGEDLETFHKHAARERAQSIMSVEDLAGGVDVHADREGQLTPLDSFCDFEGVENLNAALAVLPERTRQIVEMYYQEELPYREIGQRLGVTESRVCQILKAALVQLREHLDPCG